MFLWLLQRGSSLGTIRNNQNFKLHSQNKKINAFLFNKGYNF